MENRYEDKEKVALLRERICSSKVPLTIMEVCGTHTMSIARWGLRSLLPEHIRLVSGPGCPVCVTDSTLISAALSIAAAPNVIFTSFGDMLRVPSGKRSLLKLRDNGADIRIVLSPMDALDIASEHPESEVVFFAVGFETTAPLIAATLQEARRRSIKNFSIIPGNKTMPEALRVLLKDSPHIGGLLCPGHVSAMIGAESFRFLAEELKKPAAVCGFTPMEILTAVVALVEMAEQGEVKLVNCYPRAVRNEGNPYAAAAIAEVFMPADASWRGLGEISGSGLSLMPDYAEFNALLRFDAVVQAGGFEKDHPGCCCGLVLRGEMAPVECPLFAKACTPMQPCGACMVSSEGSCAAAYRYERNTL